MSIMQKLYDSEINVFVSSFWDGGFEVKLGDEMNGFVAEAQVETWDAVEEWLDQAARQHYPKSVYASEVSEPAPGGVPVSQE